MKTLLMLIAVVTTAISTVLEAQRNHELSNLMWSITSILLWLVLMIG